MSDPLPPALQRWPGPSSTRAALSPGSPPPDPQAVSRMHVWGWGASGISPDVVSQHASPGVRTGTCPVVLVSVKPYPCAVSLPAVQWSASPGPGGAA